MWGKVACRLLVLWPMTRALRLSSLALLSIFALLPGCATETNADEDAIEADTESAEGELARACELGVSCRAQKLLAARLYPADERAPARRRAEIRVLELPTPVDAYEAVPRVFAQKTTGTFTFAGDKRVLLSGSADGASPFEVDDFLLVEVLGQDGALLAAGHVGGASPIQVGTARSTQLATYTDFSVAPTDIAPLLPRDRPFRLRVTALDFNTRALVSDVHLVAADAPPPPSRVDLFDDAAFAPNAPLSRAEAVALFAPGASRADLGAFVFAQRSRTCNRVTGCAGWTATNDVSLSGVYRAGTGGWYENPTTSAVPRGVVTGKTWLEIANGNVVFALKSNQGAMYAAGCVTDGSAGCGLQTSTTSCYWRADRTQNCTTYPSHVQASNGASLSLRVTVSRDHVRARSATYATTADASGAYLETEYLLYAPTRGGAVTLVPEGGKVFLQK